MIDHAQLFCECQDITETASANTLDTGIGDIGKSGNIYLEVLVSKSDATPTADTVITLYSSDNADMSEQVASVVFTLDKNRIATGGTALVTNLPSGMKRYHSLGIAAGAGSTGAAITAGYSVDGGQTNT